MDNRLIRRYIKESSSPYLAAEENMWINGDGKVLDFSEMTTQYRINCIGELKKQKDNIKSGLFLKGVEIPERDKEEVINKSVEFWENKMKELLNYK